MCKHSIESKEVFLANGRNKHQFILLLSRYLQDDGQVVQVSDYLSLYMEGKHQIHCILFAMLNIWKW